jgi:bifunctional non-homologous end joining protein LigD
VPAKPNALTATASERLQDELHNRGKTQQNTGKSHRYLEQRPLLHSHQPCLPSTAERPSAGPEWVHEIKHDGYRLMARRDPVGVRLLTRNGHDWASRYSLIVEAVNRLKARSCLIDGEAVACDDNGVAVFARLRRKPSSRHVFLFAFDLLELDGEDLRREPFETRKATLASLLRGCLPGLRINEHLPYPGDVVYRHACNGPRRDGVEAAGLALRVRPHARVAQDEEPGRASGPPGSGRGLGQAIKSPAKRTGLR